MVREQLNFNKHLSRARRVVENAFGILSNRFAILLSKINLSPEKVEYIVQATVALHNFLAAKNRSAYIGSEEELTTLRHVRNSFSNRTAASVLKVREELTQYFVENDG